MIEIRAIVTDIEGTTSSIDFVRDVLFPYARKRLPAFVATHGDKPEVQHWLHEAAREAGLVEASRQDIIELLLKWIDQDRKSTALKALQGMIWKDGYEAGDYRAHVYPEVAARLRDWRADGLRLYVYSSGSVSAQKLFFRHSEAGDLSALFAGYFDTETGPKREAESYRRIAEAIGEQPRHLLFLSDIAEELDAAQAAGFHTGWLVRAAQALPDSPRHPVYRDFEAITP
ncbi:MULTISPECIES: acireductone synthase [Rhodanobacter]|uniref:acireductone synthase n=1 Tax=Rhodanobacter TaxID=75309 RepID=UPI0003FE9F97|nr:MULTISPECIES: acireductone synthase [Rhodanobacter]KZC20277.1 2,3-diketo-5-methylthio-1-phosphopentane phosphatase [Rhodanobacter denitrificans]UJJ52412.1 acireductone synthase [Rhodanobacter denitrificans]UJM95165.1 acireductone synthase [Rhodanobacter denitrificans]UJM98696.1 acireductone synthase [Rhodanobacter denitrificans]UJN21889.1 acireductone synthase [Rhodanobacter denitrificans]